MRDITKVKVDKLIVHMMERKRKIVVDGVEQTPERLVLSDRCAPLDPDSELAIFLGDHIVESLRDTSAKAALFHQIEVEATNGTSTAASDAPPDTLQPQTSPLEACRSILRGEDGVLVDGSQDLAKRLWQVLLGNDAIADGDLAVCLFTVIERSKAPVKEEDPYLALIKLEPVGAFRNVVAGENTDETLVTLESDPYVFPRRTDILQKGAYIRTLDKDGTFHMLIVDKQTHRGIARFFTRDFLNVGFVEDAAEKTLRLFEGLVATLNNLLKGFRNQDGRLTHLTSTQYLTLARAIYEPFAEDYPQRDPNTGRIIPGHRVFDRDGKFNFRKWLKRLELPVDADIKANDDLANRQVIKRIILEQITEHMKGELTIEIDRALVKHRTGRRKILLQKGGSYSIPREEFERMIKSIRWIGNRFEVVFETTSWYEKLR